MGHSFFTTNVDSNLLYGSQNFSNKINESPESYGLSVEQAQAYAEVNATWADAYRTAFAPDTHTTGNVITKNQARASMKAAVSKLAAIIQGTPSVTDGQKLELGLSVRKQRSPMAEPGVPYGQTIALGSLGHLTLTWKCDNPRGAAGTMYQVRRQLNTAGPFEYLGVSGTKSFVDDTIPMGTRSAIYEVQAVRSTKIGKVVQFNVNLGVSPGNSELLKMQRVNRAA